MRRRTARVVGIIFCLGDDLICVIAISQARSGRRLTICGGTDQTIRMPNFLQVSPQTAELWDGPSSKAVAVFEFLKSQISGARPNLGENRKTTVTMR